MDQEFGAGWRVVTDAETKIGASCWSRGWGSCWSRGWGRAGGAGMSRDTETVLSFYKRTLFA